jgi:hypothetical protein
MSFEYLSSCDASKEGISAMSKYHGINDAPSEWISGDHNHNRADGSVISTQLLYGRRKARLFRGHENEYFFLLIQAYFVHECILILEKLPSTFEIRIYYVRHKFGILRALQGRVVAITLADVCADCLK